MKQKKNTWIIFILVSFVSGILGGLIGAIFFDFDNGENQMSLEQRFYVEESQTIAAIDQVASAVVSISTFKDVPLGFGYGEDGDTSFFAGISDTELIYSEVSGGTGFIVNNDGLLVTNKHVVADGQADFKVTTFDGIEYEAQLISTDPYEDIAILRIVVPEGVIFPKVEFGDSDELKVGQRVLAIGNALSEYENTVTSGIISAKGREVTAFDEFSSVVNFSGLIQTDAAINFGNSGGPLVNLDGKVVGINVAVAEAANGIGFALPVNELIPILESVRKHGKIIRPVLGLRFVMLSEVQAHDLDSSLNGGALVIGDGSFGASGVVSGGAAEEAGIQEMDVILEVNGEPVTMDLPLHKLIRKYEPGDTVSLRYWRKGNILISDVTLKSKKDLE